MGILDTDVNAAFYARPPFIVEGHHIAVDSIREAVESRHLQTFGPQPDDAAFRFHNLHMEGKHLHICLCLGKPRQFFFLQKFDFPLNKLTLSLLHTYPAFVPVQTKLDRVLL